MATAEAQARLNICLKDIIAFFENAGIDRNSLSLLESFLEKHQTVDFLNLAEGYGKCMAFIDHDELVGLLLKSYTTLIEGYLLERKQVNKRLKILKEDKKADPDVVSRLEHLIVDIDNRKAAANVINNRLKAMNLIPAKLFLDPNFDAYSYYKTALAKQRELHAAQQVVHKSKR